MTAPPMTDPLAGSRIFVTGWPKHSTAATPPPVIKVPERDETDVSEIADIISPLTASARADLRNAIFADARKRVNATVAELNGTPWNKWCYLTGLRYGPAFAAGVFGEEEREQLVEAFVDRAHNEGWNVREAEAGIRNGLGAATDVATNFTIRELSKIRQRDEMVAAALLTVPAAGAANVKTAGQLIMEQLMKATEKVKVLWNGDSYRTLLEASLAIARASRDHVFASSVSGRLSTVGFVNGRATAENFLTADHVKELMTRGLLILEPVSYAPANVGDSVVAPEKVPPGIKFIKTAVVGPRNTTVVKTAWTCEGVTDAFNAPVVLTDGATGKPKHDPETTVWLPVEKLDSLTFKLAVRRRRAARAAWRVSGAADAPQWHHRDSERSAYRARDPGCAGGGGCLHRRGRGRRHA
jgi:hypothetical protein